MNFPQTEAEILETKITNIRKYGCCAFTTLWALGLDDLTNKEATELLIQGIDNKSLDSDCTVNWLPFTKFVTGKNYGVEMITLQEQSWEELLQYEGRIIVRFDAGQNYHWVGVENGEVKFNSLKYSYCVTYGKPTLVRILTEK